MSIGISIEVDEEGKIHIVNQANEESQNTRYIKKLPAHWTDSI